MKQFELLLLRHSEQKNREMVLFSGFLFSVDAKRVEKMMLLRMLTSDPWKKKKEMLFLRPFQHLLLFGCLFLFSPLQSLVGLPDLLVVNRPEFRS